MADNSVGYVAVYDDVNSALADLDALGALHDDDLIGKYDAAVIDQESGKPHIVKRVDRPRIDVLPKLVAGAASDRASNASTVEAESPNGDLSPTRPVRPHSRPRVLRLDGDPVDDPRRRLASSTRPRALRCARYSNARRPRA